MHLIGTRHTVQAPAEANLTELEHVALTSQLNVADGHARQCLSPGQRRIVESLPSLYDKSMAQPVNDLERAAHRAFLHLVGQHSYPAGDVGVLTTYSSSVAMEILARALVTSVDRVALIHPTFDNIPDILRGVGLELVPVEEEELHGRGAELVPDGVGCLFVTTPNNPTGAVLSASALARIGRECADKDVVLALDTSFRGFDPRAHFDHYAVLRSTGCRWVVIEDTGKLWPTLDLKVGLLVSEDGLGLPIAKIYSDILLGVSPFVLALVEQFAEDAAAGGLAELHRFVDRNRAVVRDGLSGIPGVGFPDPLSRVSVERVDLGRHRRGIEVWQSLHERGVHALPCTQFHWAEPTAGAHSLRLALARPTESLRSAVAELRSVLRSR